MIITGSMVWGIGKVLERKLGVNVKCHMLKKSGITVLLLIFVISISPIPFDKSGGDSLSAAITQMKLLENTKNTAQTNFTLVFSDTVAAFKLMAGFKSFVPNTEKNPKDNGTAQITICIKVPLFLETTHNLDFPATSKNLPNTNNSNIYNSINLLPETPPPIAA